MTTLTDPISVPRGGLMVRNRIVAIATVAVTVSRCVPPFGSPGGGSHSHDVDGARALRRGAHAWSRPPTGAGARRGRRPRSRLAAGPRARRHARPEHVPARRDPR